MLLYSRVVYLVNKSLAESECIVLIFMSVESCCIRAEESSDMYGLMATS